MEALPVSRGLLFGAVGGFGGQLGSPNSGRILRLQFISLVPLHLLYEKDNMRHDLMQRTQGQAFGGGEGFCPTCYVTSDSSLTFSGTWFVQGDRIRFLKILCKFTEFKPQAKRQDY